MKRTIALNGVLEWCVSRTLQPAGIEREIAMQHRTRNRAAFTLLEVMIAM
ncbi:MAG: prepilin-type N-terminal cleavage/methylation domain-containing protein, partial [Planctomycetes bacterium]|nr:prepilin-type N-terminal cleavage/methylation domain-containing protein [Planctomycetota bacterium]